MSVTPKGQYSGAVVFDENKRYYILQSQKNRPLTDSEVRELNNNLLNMGRREMASLMGRIASPAEPYSSPAASSGPNNAFKITQASNSTNNFTITGGAGVDDPAILYLDGFYLFYKGSFDYNTQNNTLLPGESLQDALRRDNFTQTAIPALTTPGASPRTDVVYVDLSFAEVTGNILGSEYTDPAIIDPVLGVNSANRLRAVIDIRVYENWSGVTDDNIYDDPFFDPALENQIQHYKCPIAILSRQAGNPAITTGMVTDLITRDDLRVYTPKELTHRLRHGGYTQADVDAGRAIPSDLDESWGATGKNEGLSTEAYNSDSVTPRVLQDSGKFRMGALAVSGASGTTDPDARNLLSGEVVGGKVYLNEASIGFTGTSLTDQRGDTGAILHVNNRGSVVAAIATRTDAEGSAVLVRSGSNGAPSFQVRGKGWVGINTGLTGPQRELDVIGDARISTDLEVGQDLAVDQIATIGSKLVVGASGIISSGDYYAKNGVNSPIGMHLGTTGTDSDYWAHIIANHATLAIDNYNSAGATGKNYTWSTDIGGTQTEVASLSNLGDLVTRRGISAGGDLYAHGSAGINGDLGVTGLVDVLGGIRASSFPVAYATSSMQENWYLIASFGLAEIGNDKAFLNLKLNGNGNTTGSSWSADITINTKIQLNVVQPHHVTGVMTSDTDGLRIQDVFQVVRLQDPVGGYHVYQIYAKPYYTWTLISAASIGGSLVSRVAWYYTTAGSSIIVLPDGDLATFSSTVSAETNLYVPGTFGASGAVTLQSTLAVGDDADVNGDLVVHGALSVDHSLRGEGFNIPAFPTAANPAWFGTTGAISGYTGGVDHTVEIDTGAAAVGSGNSWGTFVGTDESGVVGFKIGVGNTQPGRARPRGWNVSDLKYVVDRAPSLRNIVGIAFDTYGNCIAAIRDYASTGANSLVFIDTLSRATLLLATGFRAISDIKSSPDGFMYVTSELSTPSQDFKLARVTLYYGPDKKPKSAAVQPIALSTSVRGLAGVAVAKSPMVFNAGTFPTGTLFVVENASTAGLLLAVDPETGIAVTLNNTSSDIAAIEAGSLYGNPHALFVVAKKPTAQQLMITLATGAYASFGTNPGDLAFESVRKLSLAVDGYLYGVDGSATATNAGRLLRIDQTGAVDLIVQGMGDPRAFCMSSNRVMHIGDTAQGSVYSHSAPGALVVHMDYPVSADSYAFPGSVALDTEVKEVEIDVGSAGLLSFYGSDVKIDKRLVTEGDAFFEKDVYVDGKLHMDDMEAGDFRATVMIVGKNAPAGDYWSTADGASGTSGTSGSSGSAGAISDLDVWGDAIVQKMLLVGIDPTSTHAQSLIYTGTVGNGGVAAYVFGELQAYDYRAVGDGQAIGIYSIETANGHIAAMIGGDDALPYSVDGGTGGTSGLSGTQKKVGIHLIDADSLIVDKDAGDSAVFMQVQGDLEVVRELSVRTIRHTAIGPNGVDVHQFGVVSSDTTSTLVKEFSMSVPTALRGDDAQFVYRNQAGEAPGATNYVGWSYTPGTTAGYTAPVERSAPCLNWQGSNIGPWGPDGSYGNTGVVYTWTGSNYSNSGGIYSPGVLPVNTASDGTITRQPGPKHLDRITLAYLGEIRGEYKGCIASGIDISATSARAILVSYGFASDTMVGTDAVQDWLGAANFYPSTVTVRADIIERSGPLGFAESHHIQKSFQVFIPADSWYAPKQNVAGSTADYYSMYLVPGSFIPGSVEVKGLENGINRAWASRDAAVHYVTGNPLVTDSATDTYVSSGLEYQTERHANDSKGLSGMPTRTSDWMLALYPAFKSAKKKLVGTSGDFNWVAVWDLEVALVPMKDKQVSTVVGQLAIADEAGVQAWSSANPPWTLQSKLPWTSPMDIQASINSDKFIYDQTTAATVWTIVHDLGGYPSVTVYDALGEQVLADVKYLSPTQLEVTLTTAITGRAVLN